jgi:succinyldiaminopimelate transaminase
VNVSPVLSAQGTYPFVRIERAKRDAAAAGIEILDFGQGDPREPTDPAIRRALIEALEERMGYPKAEGLLELRRAITGWCERRFGVRLDPDTEVIPTYGSKEAIFSFAQLILDPHGPKDTVVVTEPGYPVPARGAAFAGARVEALPLLESNDFLPDLGQVEDWDRVALFWVNYPNNPTGATAPPAFYEELAERGRTHDFILCSDEAYSELWFDAPSRSALELGDRSNVAVFQTLSKRSSMTGYRSGFVAAPAEIVGALKTYRPSTGAAPQEFVQRASVVAWGDEEHVKRTRDAYRRKREALLPVVARNGWRVAASNATMYLWVEVAGDETSEECAERLLQHGVVVTPGSYLGESGEGYIRIALVPTLAECQRAAAILEDVL